MSAAAEHVYRVTSADWVHCHGQQAQDVPAWPRLTHGALMVLDTDDIVTDVWRFEGKPEHASALIEKRVRTQGLVEGTAHIVMHRLLKRPGGFQAFFSAVSLDLWQRCMQWTKEQANHCLIMTTAGLLCHGVDSGGARLLLSRRRLMCFAHTEEGMAFGSTQALGSGAADMAGAAQVLTAHQRTVLVGLGAEAVQWGCLWSTRPADVGICHAALQDVLGATPAVMPAVELALAGERVQTVLPKLARDAAARHAVNPFGERLAWRAERWVAAITVVTALAGVALVAAGLWVGQQVEQQQRAGLSLRAELVALQGRIQAVSTIEAPSKLLPVADFSRMLDDGARYDPMAFLAVLKATSGRDIRIQRVKLEASTVHVRRRAFRVDGVVAPGASVSVARWVGQMTAAGWTLKALAPVEGSPGAFSYELVATAAISKGVAP